MWLREHVPIMTGFRFSPSPGEFKTLVDQLCRPVNWRKPDLIVVNVFKLITNALSTAEKVADVLNRSGTTRQVVRTTVSEVPAVGFGIANNRQSAVAPLPPLMIWKVSSSRGECRLSTVPDWTAAAVVKQIASRSETDRGMLVLTRGYQ